MSRVTSVELEEEDVNYVEALMKDGRARSLKEFVEKCVKFGRQYTLDRWMPGLFYVGPLRIVIMPQKALLSIVERIPQEDYEDVGRELGEITRSFALFQHRIETEKNFSTALKIMSDYGFGQFIMSDKNDIQVISPAFPFEITKALIETVLNVKLETIKMKIDVQLFKVVQ